MKYSNISFTNLLPVQKFLSEKRLKSITKGIQKDPNHNITITVINADESGKYYITNGHHRAGALYSKGYEFVRCQIRTRKSHENVLRFLTTHNYTHINELQITTESNFVKYIKNKH